MRSGDILDIRTGATVLKSSSYHRYVAIPGVGVGDITGKVFFKLDKNLGLPVGWTPSGALILAKGRSPGDENDVKPTS